MKTKSNLNCHTQIRVERKPNFRLTLWCTIPEIVFTNHPPPSTIHLLQWIPSFEFSQLSWETSGLYTAIKIWYRFSKFSNCFQKAWMIIWNLNWQLTEAIPTPLHTQKFMLHLPDWTTSDAKSDHVFYSLLTCRYNRKYYMSTLVNVK